MEQLIKEIVYMIVYTFMIHSVCIYTKKYPYITCLLTTYKGWSVRRCCAYSIEIKRLFVKDKSLVRFGVSSLTSFFHLYIFPFLT